jgi:hypothetical protein
MARRYRHLAGLEPVRKFELPPGLLFVYYLNMARSIKVVQKKRGRPATGNDPVTAIRLSPELREQLDGWAAANGIMSRSAAIRRLVELGLQAKGKARK